MVDGQLAQTPKLGGVEVVSVLDTHRTESDFRGSATLLHVERGMAPPHRRYRKRTSTSNANGDQTRKSLEGYAQGAPVFQVHDEGIGDEFESPRARLRRLRTEVFIPSLHEGRFGA
jgi:hypothetical protein